MCGINTSEIEHCELCRKVIGVNRKKVGQRHGVTITSVYSIGGWGSRRDSLNFSGEVCNECFEIYAEMSIGYKKMLDERRGINEPEITINNLSNVQEDKPPPKRYRDRLLQLLP